MNDKDSEYYKLYKEKVNRYRVERLGQPSIDNNDKYDPEDILREDENDFDNAPQFVANPVLSNNSDEYDSDSEYMQESMERNLKNMKRRIDSGGAKKRYAESTNYSSDEDDKTDEEDHMEMYRKIQMRESALSDEDDLRTIQSAEQRNFDRGEKSDDMNDRRQINFGNRKKRSRWGDAVEMKAASQQMPPPPSTSNPPPFLGNKPAPMLSAVRRTDPALLNYARQNYGTTDLSEEDWNKCEEHFKVNLLYQDMMRKREEFDRLAKSGKHKYEYDSDEDTTGGTWEHKMRTDEMDATAAWADALTKQSEGKHHIGDFLPPEEVGSEYC